MSSDIPIEKLSIDHGSDSDTDLDDETEIELFENEQSFGNFSKLNQNFCAADRCLEAACANLGFDLCEIWSFSSKKIENEKPAKPILIRLFVRPATIETFGSRVLLGTIDQRKEKHVLSPILVKQARMTAEPLWFNSSNPNTSMHKDLQLNTAVAIPFIVDSTNRDMVTIFYSLNDIKHQEIALNLLKALSKAACIACLKNFPAFDWEGNIKARNFYRDSSIRSSKRGSKSKLIDLDEIVKKNDAVEEAGENDLIDEFFGSDDSELEMDKLAAQPNLEMSWESLKDAEFLVNGSRCTIYTAFYESLPVVIKLVRKDTLDKNLVNSELKMETDILLRLDHPNIIKLLGAGTQPERFMVIERLDGGTLAQRCGSALQIRDRRRRFRSKTPFTYFELLTCAKQLASALRYMHNDAIPGCMVIHRDLKPDNIAFDSLGNLKILDMGLAKVVPLVEGEGSTDAVYKLTGQTGSLRYMAPEVALKKAYNGKADVYGFGMILWEMAALKKPFEGIGRETFFSAVVNGETKPQIDKKWPANFGALLYKCWAKNPSERPLFDSIILDLDEMIEEVKSQGLQSNMISGRSGQSSFLGWLKKHGGGHI